MQLYFRVDLTVGLFCCTTLQRRLLLSGSMKATSCVCIVLAVAHVEAFVRGAARLHAISSHAHTLRMAADGELAAKQHALGSL
jgi:hypothetical protein